MSSAGGFGPGKLWSLWDMINFHMGPFWNALELLYGEMREAHASSERGEKEVTDDRFKRVAHNVQYAKEKCVLALKQPVAERALDGVHDLLDRPHFGGKWPTYDEIATALQRLVEDIEHDARQEYFFHYSRESANLLRAVEGEWKGIISAFPFSRREIESGLDCYSLGDYPGCVFHMTRIAELGLRQIAKRLKVKTVQKNKPIEYATWGPIIGALRRRIEDLRNMRGNNRPLTAAKRAKRDQEVEALSTIMGDMEALLPLRDRNAHFRGTYDKGEAHSAIHRVKEMMAMLALVGS